MEGNALGACDLESSAEFFGQDPEVDDDAEIVQQSGQISFAGIRIGNLAGKMAADEGASQRMFPEGDGVDAAAFLGHQVEDAAGHGDVADPVKSEADDGAAQRIDFLPAPKDIDVDYVGGRIKREIPDVLNDHGASDTTSGIEHQVFQQGKLFRRQLDPAPGAFDESLHPVDFQIGNRKHRFRGQMAAPHQCPDAGREFTERKRFGKVVVRSSVQALDPIFHARTLGQHKHGNTRLLRPQVAQDADSVEFRQVQVKDYNVVLELSCRGPSLFSIRRNIHRVVLAFETLANESG